MTFTFERIIAGELQYFNCSYFDSRFSPEAAGDRGSRRGGGRGYRSRNCGSGGIRGIGSHAGLLPTGLFLN